MGEIYPRVGEADRILRFPRGMYVDTTNGDMWANVGDADRERWNWINGSGWIRVPRDTLEFYTELPDWY